MSLPERLAVLRGLLRRGTFSFDEAVRDADRMTVAVTLFALLELYKRGEAVWDQDVSFGPVTVFALLELYKRGEAGWEQGEPFGPITVSAS